MKSQVFGCPSCQQPFQVLAEQAGQIVQCPTCAQPVEIPDSAFTAEIPSGSIGVASTAAYRAAVPEMVSKCDHCQLQFGITAEMFGTQVACPHCQQAVEIQDPEARAPQIQIDTANKSGNAKAPAGVDSKKSKKTEKPEPGIARKKTNGKSPTSQIKTPDGSHSDTPKRASPGSQNDSKLDKPIPAGPDYAKQATAKTASAETPVQEPMEGLLPPTIARHDSSGANASEEQAITGGERSKKEPIEPAKPVKGKASDNQPDPIDHLLPPRFDVADPTRIRVHNAPNFKILLPDGAGGLKQIDQRIVRVEHDGQKVSLVALTPQQRMRRRIITNAIAILVGIAILAIAFTLLT
jgi:DNA-directed RNA polymerase subunit RPC12/RpoP